MKIVSEQFVNEKKYPLIPMGNNQFNQVKIEGKKIGQNVGAFRVNELYGKDENIPDNTSFYFRLSGFNLYYTGSKESMVVLGAIAVSN